MNKRSKVQSPLTLKLIGVCFDDEELLSEANAASCNSLKKKKNVCVAFKVKCYQVFICTVTKADPYNKISLKPTKVHLFERVFPSIFICNLCIY